MGNAVTEPRDYSHLDFWRAIPTGPKAYLFGAVELEVSWSDQADAFVQYLIPTPRHGCLWSDAEALGHIGAAVSKEASRAARCINEPFRKALRARARDPDFVAGPLLRSFQNMSGGYGNLPRDAIRGFAFQDAMGWMSAFRAAVRGGITGAEVRRLNALIGTRFRTADLREIEPIRNGYSKHTDEFSWKGMAKEQPLYQAIVKQIELNNDSAFDWGYIEVMYGMGWLSSRKRPTTAASGGTQP